MVTMYSLRSFDGGSNIVVACIHLTGVGRDTEVDSPARLIRLAVGATTPVGLIAIRAIDGLTGAWLETDRYRCSAIKAGGRPHRTNRGKRIWPTLEDEAIRRLVPSPALGAVLNLVGEVVVDVELLLKSGE